MDAPSPMKIAQLDIENFRCHQNSSLRFGTQPVLLIGPNGAGKTSILEAINILAVSKSFLPVTDDDLVARGSDGYRIRARIVHDLGTELEVRIEYNRTQGKRISTSATGQCSAQELIGLLPCVVLASNQRDLLVGEPAVRRAFVDRILAQSSASYKHALWRHRTALRQRNRLLAGFSSSSAELDAWTDELITMTAEILWKRKQFIEEFNQILSRTTEQLHLSTIQPLLNYSIPWLEEEFQPTHWKTTLDNFHSFLQHQITKILPLDRERLSTQWGPQRDHITIITNGHTIASSTSQGQQKLALYALKIAEARYLHTATDRTPIILLDDVFSDLDARNIRRLEESILERSSQWQLFLTAPSTHNLSQQEQFTLVTLGNIERFL